MGKMNKMLEDVAVKYEPQLKNIEVQINYIKNSYFDYFRYFLLKCVKVEGLPSFQNCGHGVVMEPTFPDKKSDDDCIEQCKFDVQHRIQ